jgi:hypothetical protein
MSATQLLNAEVEKAASELAESLGEGNYAGEAVASDDDNAGRVVGSEDDTSIEMQLTIRRSRCSSRTSPNWT